MTDRELMQQALDVLEEAQSYTSCETWSPSMTDECAAIAEALRARLAQPELKPASWGVQEGYNLHDVFLFKDEADEMCQLKGTHARAIPLYTAPPQREWQGLTDEEKQTIYRQADAENWDDQPLLETVEAKLKEKNT